MTSGTTIEGKRVEFDDVRPYLDMREARHLAFLKAFAVLPGMPASRAALEDFEREMIRKYGIDVVHERLVAEEV